jgi:dolichol-phosphate mannosyltransferase
MWGFHQVAVVIPAYQEEILLPITLRSLPSWIDAVIVVDDASQDQTADVALELRSTLSSVSHFHVIRCATNGGVGKAICIGYQKAIDLQMDIAVVVGADAQMDAREMPRLLDACIQGADYVKGDRLSHVTVKECMPKMRYWGNRVLSYLTGKIMGVPHLSDAQCGYTAIRLSVFKHIDLHMLYPRYGFPNDLLLKLAVCNAKITQVPVTPIYANEQSKLRIPKVIVPILGVLLRGYIRKMKACKHSVSSNLGFKDDIRSKEYE